MLVKPRACETPGSEVACGDKWLIQGAFLPHFWCEDVPQKQMLVFGNDLVKPSAGKATQGEGVDCPVAANSGCLLKICNVRVRSLICLLVR